MKKSFRIKTDIKAIQPVMREILDALKGINSDIVHDIKLAAEEAIINAMKHGNRCNENLSVMVDFEYNNEKAAIAVQDEGTGYDYARVPDPTLDENVTKGHGRGVFLIRRLMDEVHFNNSGNRVEMVKYLKGPSSPIK
ncbi:MAG: ATP-binding protein [Candidatus Omnitrophica bacterium]|nr:ATP-binding protein [Candidatus Omnitrophota bacterium]